MRPQNSSSQKGLALPAAVWASLILFLMTAGVLNLTLGQGRQVFTEKALAERELAAESAFLLAVKALHDDKTGDKKDLLSSPITFSAENFDVSVLISAEAGKINLNLADKKLITGLFIEAGLSRAEADTLGERIVDYRSATRKFQSLNEVTRVRGMTLEFYLNLQPDLTLYSDRPQVRAEYASPRLLKVLAAIGEDFSSSGSSVLKPAEFETGTTWRLNATITNRAGVEISKTWIIRLTGNEEKPYLLHWQG